MHPGVSQLILMRKKHVTFPILYHSKLTHMKVTSVIVFFKVENRKRLPLVSDDFLSHFFKSVSVYEFLVNDHFYALLVRDTRQERFHPRFFSISIHINLFVPLQVVTHLLFDL